MSATRARANHSLYLAKIIVQSWRAALAEENIAASALDEAFFPAARGHLADSYGWFLLEICAADMPGSGQPPRNCLELPDLPEGKAVPGEIREFQQMESSGWLQDMLALPVAAPEPGHSTGNIAAVATQEADCERVRQWLSNLEALFSRMRDSLEEC